MALDTVLLAVGAGDKNRNDVLSETVTDIAGPADAVVTLVHVFTQEEFEAVADQLDYDPATEVEPNEIALRHATVRSIADRLSDSDVSHTIRGAVGPHGESIVSIATEIDADLVVVGGRQRSPTGKAVFGSTAQEIMLNAPCPVTFVRDRDEDPSETAE